VIIVDFGPLPVDQTGSRRMGQISEPGKWRKGWQGEEATMHEALLISMLFVSAAHMPSLTTMLISVPVLGFLLYLGSRSAFKSAKTKAADRILTNQLDDKGLPLFFDVDSNDGSAFTAARDACRVGIRRR